MSKNDTLNKFRTRAKEIGRQQTASKKRQKLFPVPSTTTEDVTTTQSENEQTIPNKTSSENFAKLPTLKIEEIKFFDLITQGDLVGLKDFMQSPAYSKININKTDKYGFSGLHHAVKRQDEEMVSLFLEQKGILTYDTLFHAILEENIPITKLLLEHQDRISPQLMGSSIRRIVPTTLPLPGLPRVLSPTKITTRQSLTDLEEFDSEFPIYFTPLLIAAILGNTTLIEMFYDRGERLESELYNHNTGCACRICGKSQDFVNTSAFERLDLFDAITNPNYISFISRKTRNHDPANYAIEKIKKCRRITLREDIFADKYADYESRLSDYLKDLIDLCRNNDEAETFFSVPDPKRQGRLKGKYPRLWTLVGLDLENVVAHSHTQYVANKQWATNHWPEWTTYNRYRIVLTVILTILLWPLYQIILWFTDGWDSKWRRRWTCPLSKYLHGIGSYVWFLGILGAQVYLPSRCLYSRYKFYVPDADCPSTGPPTIGTEWALIIFVIGRLFSTLKLNSIPWMWKSTSTWWARIDLLTNGMFVMTFIFWLWSWASNVQKSRNDSREYWGQYYPEIFGESSLAIACILAFSNTLQLLRLNQVFGPMQISLGNTLKTFLPTVGVYLVVVFSFSTGLNAIYVPFNGIPGKRYDGVPSVQTSPFGKTVLSPSEELFWVFFGMSGNDKPLFLDFESAEPRTYNHHTWSEMAGKILFFAYNVIGVLTMHNMLLSHYTSSAAELKDNSDTTWKFTRAQIYLTYTKDTVLSPPFNLIPTFSDIRRFFKFLRLLCHMDTDEDAQEDEHPACSFRQCCFLRRPIDKEEEGRNLKAYRRLALNLLRRYTQMVTERENNATANSDDVKEIGEELAELKAKIQSKMRELQEQVAQSQSNATIVPSSQPQSSTATVVSPSVEVHEKVDNTEKRRFAAAASKVVKKDVVGRFSVTKVAPMPPSPSSPPLGQQEINAPLPSKTSSETNVKPSKVTTPPQSVVQLHPKVTPPVKKSGDDVVISKSTPPPSQPMVSPPTKKSPITSVSDVNTAEPIILDTPQKQVKTPPVIKSPQISHHPSNVEAPPQPSVTTPQKQVKTPPQIKTPPVTKSPQISRHAGNEEAAPAVTTPQQEVKTPPPAKSPHKVRSPQELASSGQAGPTLPLHKQQPLQFTIEDLEPHPPTKQTGKRTSGDQGASQLGVLTIENQDPHPPQTVEEIQRQPHSTMSPTTKSPKSQLSPKESGHQVPKPPATVPSPHRVSYKSPPKESNNPPPPPPMNTPSPKQSKSNATQQSTPLAKPWPQHTQQMPGGTPQKKVEQIIKASPISPPPPPPPPPPIQPGESSPDLTKRLSKKKSTDKKTQ